MRPLSIAMSCLVGLLVSGVVLSMASAQTPAAVKEATKQKPAESKPAAAEVLRVVSAGAALHKPDKSVEHLGRGTRIEVSKVRDAWIGGYALVGEA